MWLECTVVEIRHRKASGNPGPESDKNLMTNIPTATRAPRTPPPPRVLRTPKAMAMPFPRRVSPLQTAAAFRLMHTYSHKVFSGSSNRIGIILPKTDASGPRLPVCHWEPILDGVGSSWSIHPPGKCEGPQMVRNEVSFLATR